MLGVCISIIAIIWVAWMIAKKGYAPGILLIAGIALLVASVVFHLNPGLGLKKSTGSLFFDIFQVAENIFSSNVGGLGLSIMAMGGFAKYMDSLNASYALYSVVGGPLRYIKSPYLLASLSFIVTQIIGFAIPSAAGLALVLMVTLYPLLIRSGVSRLTALAIIGSSRFFDLGPGSASCLLAAKTAKITWAEYFLDWQLPVFIPLLITMVVSHYFVQQYWDRKEGPDPEIERIRQEMSQSTGQENLPPKIYALLPIIPLAILLIFNPIVSKTFGPAIEVGVPSAMIISVLVTMMFEWARYRSGLQVLAGFKNFYEGMGKQFTVVVALIVGGQIFGAGLVATGAVDTLLVSAENAGFGAGMMIIIVGFLLGLVGFLMGSGNAPFFSFASLIPGIAAKFNIHSAAMLVPLENMTGFGRTVSPVTGAIVAIAGLAGVSPFQVVKRSVIPMILCVIVNYVFTFLFIFH